jgi:hypothetical protein
MVTSLHGKVPALAFGERFRVESQRGTRYVARCIHPGERDTGVYVRLEDRRIARLDHRRLAWKTYAKASDDGEHVLQVGDEVLVEAPSGTHRGPLEEAPAQELCVRGPRGVARVQRNTVLALSLLFRARELKAGDRFIVRSRSGNEYHGAVNTVDGSRLAVTLRDGREVTLHLDRVDLETLVVCIPLPLDRI